MKTIYSILIISFFIGYTSAQERDSIVGGWEYPQNFYELYRLNAKGEKLTTHSNVFTILKKPQSSYTGTYQKGQPYEGFFIQKGKMPLNFRVDEYEKGKKIKEYCFAPLGKENNNYPIKLDEIAKVENGQAVTDGTVFKERKIDKVTYLTITNYKNGSPHKCLFVMYHDIINAWLFSLEKDFITIAYEDKEDLMNLKIYKKDDELVGDLLSGGRTFHTRKHSITVEKGTSNASIYYYLDDKQQLKEYYFLMKRYDNEETIASDIFITSLYTLLPITYKHSITEAFSDLVKGLNNAFETEAISSKERLNFLSYLLNKSEEEFTKLLKNEQVIGFLINEDGKLYGTKITPLPDKTYQIDCYNGNNKKKSTIKIKKLDAETMQNIYLKM